MSNFDPTSRAPAAPPPAPAKKPLGTVLLEMGLLNPEQLALSLKRADAKKMRFGDFVVQEGLVTEVDIAKALARQHEIEYRDLTGFVVSPEALKILPEKVVRRFLILPIELRQGTLVLAVNNPIDVEMLDLVGRVLKMPIHLNISPRPQLMDVIESAFEGKTAVDTLVQNLRRQEAKGKPGRPPLPNTLRLEPAAPGEASIEALVNRFLEQGVRELASDIHIDPAAEGSRVRMRIDGILHEMHRYPAELHNAIISRMKVLSGLDIAEKRNAQDGRFQYQFLNHEVDVRISMVPTIRGEKAVLRLLNKRKQTLGLEEVGMSPELVAHISELVARPYGIVFVTGPTGSGKTTSLYSMLHTLNGVERNIVTVEDPVEFTFDLINQIQVNEKAGVTFPSILRNILRQDPDVMMIGEVRDAETAQIAVQAALTGHLVLSTLHTNGAVSAISRLIDMKIEPFLLSSSLLAVLAQRLVRRLCLGCRKPKVADARDSLALGEALLPVGTPIFEAGACDKCHQSGYRGRIPIFELMRIDEWLHTAINERKSEVEMLAHLRDTGFRNLREDGVRRIREGLSTVDEVLRAT